MGKPFGKASRRTFIRNGTPLPLTSWNSPKVKFFDHIKNLKTTAFRSLEGRFAHVQYATLWSIRVRGDREWVAPFLPNAGGSL